MSDYIIEVTEAGTNLVDHVPTAEVLEVVSQGPQGIPGPPSGLLLEQGAEVPPGTPVGTIIFEKG